MANEHSEGRPPASPINSKSDDRAVNDVEYAEREQTFLALALELERIPITLKHSLRG
jgi:hypothetical protein